MASIRATVRLTGLCDRLGEDDWKLKRLPFHGPRSRGPLAKASSLTSKIERAFVVAILLRTAMKAEVYNPRRLDIRSGFMTSILAFFYFSLILARVLVNNIYINTMPQDLFATLDGIYRVHLGQIPHRDFSTVIGSLHYALPALFMSHGAGIISSVNYSEAALVFIAFFLYLYIARTRLDPMAGFFLGIWYP